MTNGSVVMSGRKEGVKRGCQEVLQSCRGVPDKEGRSEAILRTRKCQEREGERESERRQADRQRGGM